MIWINWNLQYTNGTKTFLRCERHYATIIWMTYELHYENINAVSRQAYNTISSQEIRRKRSRMNRKEEEEDYLKRGNQQTMMQMVVVYILIELNWTAWNGSSLHTNSCPGRTKIMCCWKDKKGKRKGERERVGKTEKRGVYIFFFLFSIFFVFFLLMGSSKNQNSKYKSSSVWFFMGSRAH